MNLNLVNELMKKGIQNNIVQSFIKELSNYLENIIDNNLDKIDSIRYTFVHNYRECSYLESYQNALDKLNRLEENIKERKNDVAKMKKEMEYQLEKNNAKVIKFECN